MCEERLHKRFDDPEYGIDSKNTMPRDILSLAFKAASKLYTWQLLGSSHEDKNSEMLLSVGWSKINVPEISVLSHSETTSLNSALDRESKPAAMSDLSSDTTVPRIFKADAESTSRIAFTLMLGQVDDIKCLKSV